MSISSEVCTVTAQGNGSTTSWPFSFLIPYQADGTTQAVVVFLTVVATGVRTVLELGSQYGITGVGDTAGGSVEYPLMGSPIAVGTYITIDRDLDYVQPYTVANQSFYPHTVEQVADYVVMQTQQLERDALRAVTAPCVVASLPTAGLNLGMRGTALDATATTYGSIVAGSGSNVVPVISNGVHWVIG